MAESAARALAATPFTLLGREGGGGVVNLLASH
jgi:hypothetical protein